MDYGRKAAIFRASAKEIRSSAAAMTGTDSRDQLMKIVDYYEQMATTYDDLEKLKAQK